MVWVIIIGFVFVLVVMMVVMVEVMMEETATMASSDPTQLTLATNTNLGGSSTNELGLSKAA